MKLTFEEVLQSVERAIAEKGEDYVYQMDDLPSCVYFDPETAAPSCIVGHVLSDYGFTYDDLRGVNAMWVRDLLRGDYDVECDDARVAVFLIDLQMHQDAETPWGESRDLALKAVNRG